MIYRLKQKFDNVRLPQFAGGVAVIVYAVTSAIKTTRQKKR